eukprot:GHUV01028342.1.p1 GENE.GHUV01028342.1~~GHUV01028342.1.p1  ORF type:complete len:125 (-),score=8.60 GHUV01028342.1:140-514(-)
MEQVRPSEAWCLTVTTPRYSCQCAAHRCGISQKTVMREQSKAGLLTCNVQMGPICPFFDELLQKQGSSDGTTPSTFFSLGSAVTAVAVSSAIVSGGLPQIQLVSKRHHPMLDLQCPDGPNLPLL